jgi:orotidine-5'-phosphate decarboxylase
VGVFCHGGGGGGGVGGGVRLGYRMSRVRLGGGAHYRVVGGPITAAPDPARAAEAVLREMGA